ncbi:MAG: hypothetical protein ACP6IY_22100 [Promethearchaeia archaeon]
MSYTKPTKPFNYDIIKSWYKTPAIKFELIKFLYKREFALLVPKYIKNLEIKKRSVRTLKCHSVQHLDINLNATQMFMKNTPYNFYYSLAKYKFGIPNQTLNFAERDNSDWVKNHYKFIESYDYLIDIDAGDFDDLNYAYYSAKNIKKMFDKLNVPYELRFSGMGFHFIIPYSFLPQNLSFNPAEDNNLYKFLFNLSALISEDKSEMIDENIYDCRRICKIPYSIALYENDGFVCTPFLNDEQFNKFKIENKVIYTSLYRLRPINYPYKVQNRGTYLFNPTGDLSLLLLRYDLKEYIKELKIYQDFKNKGGIH